MLSLSELRILISALSARDLEFGLGAEEEALLARLREWEASREEEIRSARI